MPADQYPPEDPRRRWAQDEAAPSAWGAPADAPPPAPPSGWNPPNQTPPPPSGRGPAQAPPPSWGEPRQAPPPSWDAAPQAPPPSSWGAAGHGPPAPWDAPGQPPAAWSTRSSAAGAWATYSEGEAGPGNLGLAIMGGFAGAVVAGLIWWGIIATTRIQVVYLAFGVGWIVAQGVLICAQQRNRIPLQVVAGTFTLLALGVSEYFIQRSLFIADGGSLPLWNGFDLGFDVVREGLKEDPITALFWIAAVVVAIVVAGKQDAITQRR